MKSRATLVTLIICILAIFGTLTAFFYPRKSEEEGFPVIRKAPDFELINQDEEKVLLSQFSGKVKVLSFSYVRCTMARACPRTARNFKAIQDSLGEALNDKVVFLLVTFDPESDTPGALKKYGELYEADFTNWHFLTGSVETIDKVCEDYMIIHEKQEDGSIRHTVKTVLIDWNDDVRKKYFANEWEPEEIKMDIITLLDEGT